jgi:hypothetical protein
MLEWCSQAHAHEIARRMNVDLQNIQFQTAKDGSCVVFVDAPKATPAQIEALGEAVQEECPVARFRKTRLAGKENEKMMWVKLPPSGSDGRSQ